MPQLTRRHQFAAALATGCAAVVLLLNAVFQAEPAVTLTAELDPSDIGRVLNIVRQHDPRHEVPGQLSAVSFSERDLDVLINHIAWRRLGTPARVVLGRDSAELIGSLHLPAHAFTAVFGRWLNVQVRMESGHGMPQVVGLQVGVVPLPAWAALPLARRAAEVAGLGREFQMAGEVLRQVRFQPQRLDIAYVLQQGSAERIVAMLVPRPEQDRLRAYAERIVALAAQDNGGAPQSLARWIGPMFQLARQRSAAGNDAAAENRAAILALTLYANGRTLDSLLPGARDWPRPRMQKLTLAGRDDSPLHLLVSAALVVEGTGPLSKAVGLYKEVMDSRGGSGFSFNDLAADRAGTRLGELAVQQPQRLQAVLAGGVREADFMPHAADLPENMPEPEFKRRFGGVGAPPYVAMVAEIDRRVSALPALR